MKRATFLFLAITTVFVGQSLAQQPLAAEQITKDNAARRLFSGSDAVGGIGDWYLSNGIVEAVIDNAALGKDVAVPQQNGIAPTGGTLIDFALVGKNNDQFNQMFQIANLSPTNSFFYLGVTGEVKDNIASVTAQGTVLLDNISTISNRTLAATTTYSVAPGDRFITVTSTVVNNARQDVTLFNITDAIIWTIHGLSPFAPAPKRGFNHPQLSLSPTGISNALGVFPFIVAPGNLGPENGMMDTLTEGVCGEVSYGFMPVSIALDSDGPNGPMQAQVTRLPAFLGINSALVSGIGNPFDPASPIVVPMGGSISYTRRLFIGDRNDVAAMTDSFYQNLFSAQMVGTLSGDVNGAETADVKASVLISGKLPAFFGDEIVPITQVQTDNSGKFSSVLPAGDYTLTIISPERADLADVKVSVTAGQTNVIDIPNLSAVGQVNISISEKANLVPAKLTFIGMDGTTNPNFSRFFEAKIFDPKTGDTIGDNRPEVSIGSPAGNFVFTTTGNVKQIIKPGKYRVIASRGMEYTIAISDITVTAGQETKQDFSLERVIDTKGYVSADFHVHSARSNDTSLPLEDRVGSYVAENVEVIVSTDHNYITDFAPVLRKMAVDRLTKSIVGEEITTNLPNPVFPDGFGHHNVFPLPVVPFEPRRGAVNSEYVPAATFYDRANLLSPGVKKVFQLNHARAGIMGTGGLVTGGVFTTTKFDPTKPITTNPQLLLGSQLGTTTRNIDFNAIELYNGDSIGLFQVLRNDWISLINQGFFRTATAVSDSHRLVIDAPGFPRSYVGVPTEDISALKDEMITESVIAGNVLGTSGPFIQFDIEGKPIGSLVDKRKGKVTLNIVVSAPAWVPVEEVRILENGKQIMRFDATTNPRVTPAPSDPTANTGQERFRASIKVKPKKDAYYIVEAGTKLPAIADTNGDGVVDRGDTNADGKIDTNDRGFVQPPAPAIYSMIAPDFVPLAFTNPIFIDRNKNGKFDPPGLPKPANEPLDAQAIKQEEDLHEDSGYFHDVKVDLPAVQEFLESLPEVTRKLVKPIEPTKNNSQTSNKQTFDNGWVSRIFNWFLSE